LRKLRIGCSQFSQAIKRTCLEGNLPVLTDGQIARLFTVIDLNKDGFVDVGEWKAAVLIRSKAPPPLLFIVCVGGSHLSYIQDVIFKKQLHTDDVLKTMNLEREGPDVGSASLREALLLLDPSLNRLSA